MTQETVYNCWSILTHEFSKTEQLNEFIQQQTGNGTLTYGYVHEKLRSPSLSFGNIGSVLAKDPEKSK